MSESMKSDVMLHLSESPGMKKGYRLAARLREMEGVSEVRFNPDRDRCIQVFFDPEAVKAGRFIDAAAEQGYAARLIAI